MLDQVFEDSEDLRFEVTRLARATQLMGRQVELAIVEVQSHGHHPRRTRDQYDT